MDLHDLSAIALLDLYHRKAASPVEVARAVLRHIGRWEPHLHATYALDPEAALVQAELLHFRPEQASFAEPSIRSEKV